jgi:AsmA protein
MRKFLIVAAIVLAVLVLAVIALAVLVDPNDYRDDIAERASAQLGREVALGGAMSLRFIPRLAIEVNEVRVGNPDGFGGAPDLAQVGVATASVRLLPMLTGRLEIGAVTLEDAALSVVTSSSGRSNLEGLMAADSEQPRAEPDLSGLTLAGLRLQNVELVTLDQRTQERGIVRIESFELDAFRAGQASAFGLTATLGDGRSDALRLNEVTGTLDVSADLSRMELGRLVAEFAVPGPGLTGSLRGAAALDLSGATPVATLPQFELVAMAEGLRLGVTARAPVRALLGDPVEATLDDVLIRLNEQELTGRGTARLGEQLQVDFGVSGERFDLRPLAGATGSGPAGNDGDAANAPATAPEGLEALNLRFDLELGELVVSDALTLSEVVAEARLQAGKLTLMPMSARLLGGRFDGRVAVDFSASPPTVDLEPRLSGVAVEQLASLVSRVAPLRGVGDFDLDLSFSGLSAGEILRSIDGSGSFTVSEGALLGVDLKRLIDEELSAANFENIRRSFGGSTEFERFGGRMEVRAGVVELPDINLSASDFGLSGSGQIDLPANQVDYRVDLALGEALNDSLPRAVREALGGRLPLTISGPIGEPTVGVDLAGMAERAVRRQGRDLLLRTLLERSAHEDPSEEGDPNGDPEADPDSPP